MKTATNNTRTYTVFESIRETHDVVTLKLKSEEKTSFIPGQYITVYFPELNTPEGKSYSISSYPNEETVNITVKAIGEFSNRLCKMKPGDKLTTSLPYGFFYTENTDTDLVIFAAGIGIAPFRSMIKDITDKFPDRKIYLVLSNKTMQDIVFKDELLNSKNKKLEVISYITREKTLDKKHHNGRINIDNLINKLPQDNSEYFICGSISFVRDIWKKLVDLGIKEDTIYTEAFF